MNKDYYISKGIDASKVHEEANQRMTDRYEPASSIVHGHPFGTPCKGKIHTAYDAHTKIAGEIIPSTSQSAEVVNKEMMGNGVRR